MTPFSDEMMSFRRDIEARLAKLTPRDTVKGIFLSAYLEAYRVEGGNELYAKCFALLEEKRIVDFFSYPYAGVMKIGLLGAEVLGPKLGGIAPYLRAMGRIAVDGYLKSPLGKTFMSLVQPTPKSMLLTLPAAIRTVLSFGERRFTMTTNSSCLITCRDDFSPAEANAGAIEAVIAATGVRDVQVAVTQQSMLDYDVAASWRPVL